jgi:hypothetical protein
MGVFFSFIRSAVGDSKKSEGRDSKLNSIRSATSSATLCTVCLEHCPICFNFLAQVPHDGCGLWHLSQSTQAESEGWSRYLRFEFEPIKLLGDASSKPCSSCAVLQESLGLYEGLWKKDCSSALLIISKSLVIQLLKGQNAILILELIVKQSKLFHTLIPQTVTLFCHK